MDASLAQVEDAMAALAAQVPAAPRRAPTSGWSVGEHAAHCVQVAERILALLRAPTPTDPALTPATAAQVAVLATGTIPRGTVRARLAVSPEAATPAVLQVAISTLRAQLASATPEIARWCADPGLIRHPALGGLTRAQWLRFLVVHTRHHLGIMDEIGSAPGTTPDPPSAV